MHEMFTTDATEIAIFISRFLPSVLKNISLASSTIAEVAEDITRKVNESSYHTEQH